MTGPRGGNVYTREMLEDAAVTVCCVYLIWDGITRSLSGPLAMGVIILIVKAASYYARRWG